MLRGARGFTLILPVLVLAACSGAAQDDTSSAVSAELETTFPQAFSMVQRVHELPDGRVMVADPLGQALVVADMAAGTADTVGAVGKGPGEYNQPDAVFPLPGDSVLLVDLGNARLTVLGPDRSFTETMPIAQGDPASGGLQIVLPRATDSQGKLYFRPMGGMMGQLPDSAAVARYDRAAGVYDTLAMVKIPDMKRSTQGGAGNQNVMIRPVPLSPEDAWAVSWDGRVAVARSGDYHVEWIDPDGRVVVGDPVDYEPVAIGRAEKEEWVEGLSNGISVGISMNNGQRQMQMGRGGGGDSPALDTFEWPEYKPAFEANGVFVTPEGDIWVARHVPAGAAVHFDVFGSDAQLKGSVSLPAGRDLVGFGIGKLYAVRTDDVGLQWLEVYTRPAT
jgi:hypothetical protein